MKPTFVVLSILLASSPALAGTPRSLTCAAYPPALPNGATLIVSLLNKEDGTSILSYKYSHPSAPGELSESFSVKRNILHMGDQYSAKGVSFFVSRFPMTNGEIGRFKRTFDSGASLELNVDCPASAEKVQ